MVCLPTSHSHCCSAVPGAGVDSYYEYLVKGSQLLQRPELAAMFEQARRAVDTHMRRDDWHMWVSMNRGQVTIPVFQSLEAFWPGLLSLVGESLIPATFFQSDVNPISC